MSTPFRFRELQLRNFLSFGNQLTTVDLTDFGSTLIVGENVDASSNNGAGKTTLINAICYAFYNKPFDNISLQRLINSTNNVKNTLMEVRVCFTKGEDDYEIYRCRGENFTIQVFMNGEDITLDSVSENDKAVQEILGMSYELFTKIIIFSGNSIPFLMMPLSQQRAQIEELFNITMLTEKAVNLKEIIKATEGSIAIQEAVFREQEAQLALYNKQLQAADARVRKWEEDRLITLQQLEDQLQLLATVNMEEEKELHAVVADILKKENAVEKQLTLSKRDKSSTNSEIRKLRDELKHLLEDNCPYCLQQFAGAADKVGEKEALMATKEAGLAQLDIAISKMESEISEFSDQRYAADQVMKFATLADAVRAESNAQTAQRKIDDLIDAENPHSDALEQLQAQVMKKPSSSESDALRKELEHQQFLLKLLTDKNSFIRRRIIQRTIPFLNNRLMHYTKELGLPHVVKFDDDMSCTVAEYNRELDFGNLSSGEKKRVNLSLSLAFRDVLHHLHSKVNCLFIDEIDASLDGSGVENVFKLLKQKTRDEGLGLWIISHRPEAIGRFDRSMVIRKENGFSRILGDDEVNEDIL